jgi:ABC-type uncharacterized transport system involved in gliding motility auxiliary subunit
MSGGRKQPVAGARREVLLALLVAGIVLLAVLNSVRFFARVDMTESRAFSISPVSRNLFEEIPEQVSVTYFVSERLQQQFPQPGQIVDLLGEYVASSRGRISLQVEDPAGDDGSSAGAVDAEAFGVVPQQLQVTEEGEQTLAVVYSGIVISYLDRFETLPFVFGVSTLEYEMTSTIRDLVNDRRRSVHFLLGDDSSLEVDYSFVASRLSGTYEVRQAPPGPVADDVDVLIVAGAEMLDAMQVAAVDDYLARGGSALIGVDSVEVSLDGGLIPRSVAGGPIDTLLAEFGITLRSELVLDEAYNQIVVQEAGRGFSVQRALPYEHWITLLTQYTSADHPVTARFAGLDLYWPSWFEVVESGQTETIAATTPQAWLMTAPYRTRPDESALFRMTAAQTRGQYGVVVAASRGNGRLIAVSDADFLRDRLIQATQSGYNLTFVENAVQWLGNDEDLLSLRARSTRDVRLNAIEDPAAKRAVVILAEAVNIYLVPAAVIGVGLVRFLRRRRRARSSAS